MFVSIIMNVSCIAIEAPTVHLIYRYFQNIFFLMFKHLFVVYWLSRHIFYIVLHLYITTLKTQIVNQIGFHYKLLRVYLPVTPLYNAIDGVLRLCVFHYSLTL